MKRIAIAVLSAWPLVASADHGVDLAGIDKSVAPGDDFFDYANGTWLKQNEIPADRAVWGSGVILIEDTNKRVRQILEEAGSATSGDAKKVGDYYATVMDEAGIEAKGMSVVADDVKRIAAVADKKTLAKVFGEDVRIDVDPLNNTDFHTTRLFGTWISADLNAPDKYSPYVFQGGLGLPDREYYVNADPRMAELRSQYQKHIAAIFKLIGVPDGDARAQRVVALEMKIAKAHANRETSMDVVKANNTWKRSDFAARAPGFDWNGYFAAAGLDKAPTFIVWHPAPVRALAALFASEPLDSWKDWLTFHTVERYGGMPKAFVDEEFAFYGHTLSGTPQLADRWKRALGMTSGALGDAVGQLYVKKYFPPEAKAQLQVMVKNIIAAFDRRIDKLEWMAPATRAKAKEKLSTLYVGLGYPDTWIDYSGLEIVRGDAIGNSRRAGLYEYKRNLAKLGKPVDKTEWCMTPQTVNAVNLPLQNALNFPAAFLQPPFFDPAAPAAVNYGGIGAVIGHEISHSFDDQGAQFDAHGKLADWWTKADRKHFEAEGQALAKQYDAYAPFPDLHVNGKLTLSENISDVAGLSATHDAWLMSLNGQSAPTAQGLTGEQQFFLAYAQSWRDKARDAVLRQQLITDGHSPGRYRAYTVRNLDTWYQAFDVKPGQALFLKPDQRVRVW